MYRPAHLLCALFATLLVAAGARADASPAVSLNGSLGQRAGLLMIDGEARTVFIGQSANGVKLISIDEERAVIEVNGRRQTLALGATPARVGDAGAPSTGGSSARQIVLSSGPGGHFTTSGSINGQAAQFLVDTGATAISISQIDADRMGLRYRDGRRIITQTANGAAPANMVLLDAVRIGDVTVRNVEAIVMPAQMSHVLLGNSFLTRFQMRRDNDVLTLELRY